MKKNGRWLWILMAVATVACAGEPQISVQDAWVRAVPPVSKNSAGYLVIENRGDQDDALVAVQVGKVRVTELHEMVRNGDSMSMQRRKEIPLPAHGRAVLAPGGLHLMLIDLQQPLRLGEKLEGVLHFRHAGEVKVVLEVRSPP